MAAVIMNTWTLLLNNFASKLLPVFPRRLGCFVHFRYIADLPIGSWINFTGITRVMFIFILSYLLHGWRQILKGIFPIEHYQFLKIEITFGVFAVSQIPIRAFEKQQQIIDGTPFERFVKRERQSGKSAEFCDFFSLTVDDLQKEVWFLIEFWKAVDCLKLKAGAEKAMEFNRQGSDSERVEASIYFYRRHWFPVQYVLVCTVMIQYLFCPRHMFLFWE